MAQNYGTLERVAASYNERTRAIQDSVHSFEEAHSPGDREDNSVICEVKFTT